MTSNLAYDIVMKELSIKLMPIRYYEGMWHHPDQNLFGQQHYNKRFMAFCQGFHTDQTNKIPIMIRIYWEHQNKKIPFLFSAPWY